MTDLELLKRCVAGDERAWSDFLARFHPALRRTAAATLLRAIGSAAEDDIEAVLETVLAALVRDDRALLRAFQGRSTLSGYLRAVTARVAFNHLRSERRKGWIRFRPLASAPEPVQPEPEEASDPARLDELRRSLDRLPPRDRLLLKMFHLDGLSYREIGRTVGLPVNSVSPALSRAREKLRALMKDER